MRRRFGPVRLVSWEYPPTASMLAAASTYQYRPDIWTVWATPCPCDDATRTVLGITFYDGSAVILFPESFNHGQAFLNYVVAHESGHLWDFDHESELVAVFTAISDIPRQVSEPPLVDLPDESPLARAVRRLLRAEEGPHAATVHRVLDLPCGGARARRRSRDGDLVGRGLRGRHAGLERARVVERERGRRRAAGGGLRTERDPLGRLRARRFSGWTVSVIICCKSGTVTAVHS